MERFKKLRYTLILPAIVSVIVVMVFAIVVATISRSSEAEQQMLDGSRETAAALVSASEYISEKTPLNICSFADTDLTRIFSKRGAYLVSFISVTSDESKGLSTAKSILEFQNNPSLLELHERSGDSFVYRIPVRWEERCIACHDSCNMNDIAGTYQIESSTKSFDASAIGLALYDIFFSLFLALVCIVALWIPLRRQVTHPIEQFARATSDISNRALHTRLNAKELGARGELVDLIDSFNYMIANLEKSYDEIEAEVQKRTEQLSDAMEELTSQRKEVEALNAQLREESAYKSEFLAIISHELKTPLSSMINNVSVLRSDYENTENSEVFTDIERNGSALLSLINQILDVTRLEAGRETLEEDVVDIVDLLSAIESTFNPIAASKAIAYTSTVTDDFPLIMVDGDKLEKIIRNLMGNALKFTPKGGCVALALFYDPNNQSMLITVEDNGIGLEDVDTERIFDRFYQSDQSETRKYGGTGIGLSLVKQYAELSGGSARAICLAQGARFEVTIPAPQLTEDKDDD